MRYEYPAARMRYRGATLRLYQPCGGVPVYEPAESHPPYKIAGGGIKHHALSRTAAAPHPHRYPSPPPPPGINFCIVRQRRHLLRQAKQAVTPVKIPKVTLQPHEAACHRRGQNVPNRYAILHILLNAPSQPHRPQVPAVIRLVRQINRILFLFSIRLPASAKIAFTPSSSGSSVIRFGHCSGLSFFIGFPPVSFFGMHSPKLKPRPFVRCLFWYKRHFCLFTKFPTPALSLLSLVMPRSCPFFFFRSFFHFAGESLFFFS